MHIKCLKWSRYYMVGAEDTKAKIKQSLPSRNLHSTGMKQFGQRQINTK